jgi:hypothetical protein
MGMVNFEKCNLQGITLVLPVPCKNTNHAPLFVFLQRIRSLQVFEIKFHVNTSM